MAKHVNDALTEHIEIMCSLLGRAVGHTVLGFVYAMFESHWLQGLLKGGPWGTNSDAARGFPGGCLGQGPWVGPAISASHWCGILIYVAIVLLCPTEGDEKDMSGTSHPRAIATPQRGPAVNSALDFAMRLDGNAWPGIPRPVEAMLPWFLSHYNSKGSFAWPLAQSQSPAHA